MLQQTDSLGRVTSVTGRDPVGRVTAEQLPGARNVAFSYDLSSNLASLTPPGKPAHQFDYTPRDLVSTYEPPDLHLAARNTTYAYDFDRDLLRYGAPGEPVQYAYDTAGRLIGWTHAQGSASFNYDTAGRLASTNTDQATATAFGYDGSLLTHIGLTGPMGSHSLDYTYDNFFRVTNRTVDGGTSVTRGYDADRLLVSVGPMTLTRNPTNGMVTGTTLGVVTDAYTYDGYGECHRLQRVGERQSDLRPSLRSRRRGPNPREDGDHRRSDAHVSLYV